MHTIYALIGDQKETFYIGRTTRPKRREIEHSKDFLGVKKMGFIRLGEFNDERSAAYFEESTIRHFAEHGAPLINSNYYVDRTNKKDIERREILSSRYCGRSISCTR